MPGKNLSQAEKDLIKDWNEKAHRFPNLASISISGKDGLRGIRHLELTCDQPITVICGASGTGKSTLLELCILAYRADKNATDSGLDSTEPSFQTAAPEKAFTEWSVTWQYREDTAPAVTLDGDTRMLLSLIHI